MRLKLIKHMKETKKKLDDNTISFELYEREVCKMKRLVWDMYFTDLIDDKTYTILRDELDTNW